jgi:hypothetical protein
VTIDTVFLNSGETPALRLSKLPYTVKSPVTQSPESGNQLHLSEIRLAQTALDICYRNLMAASDAVAQREWCDRLKWWAERLTSGLARCRK